MAVEMQSWKKELILSFLMSKARLACSFFFFKEEKAILRLFSVPIDISKLRPDRLSDTKVCA